MAVRWTAIFYVILSKENLCILRNPWETKNINHKSHKSFKNTTYF